MKIKVFFLTLICFFNIYSLEINPKDINVNYEVVEKIEQKIYKKENEIEILYFFSYSCGSCYHFKPYIEQWKKIKNENVKFIPIPVDFRESWEETSKSYHIAKSLNLNLLEFEDTIYRYIHEDRKRIFFKEDLFEFFNKKFNIQENDFNKIYNSISLRIKQNKERELTDYLEIMGTPSFVVLTNNGNYFTNISLTGDPLSTIVTLEYLTRK